MSSQACKKSRTCCSNPFNMKNHKKYGVTLRLVKNGVNNILVCNTCRIYLTNGKRGVSLSVSSLTNLPNPDDNSENLEMQTTQYDLENENEVAEPVTDDELFEKEMVSETLILEINKILELLKVTPICANDRKTKKNQLSKVREIQNALNEKLKEIFEFQTDDPQDLQSLVNEIESKISQTNKSSEKIKYLTMAPITWSPSELKSRFSVSYHMAVKAKKLHEEEGIGTTSNPRPGKKLDTATDNLIKQFYYNDDYSRVMPGQKDYVSVKKDGVRVHLQKCLSLGNLKELCYAFKLNNSDIKISFSKFAELRPSECILAGGKGTHSVCVCKIHQNVKLMIAGAQFKELTKNDDEISFLQDYKSILPKIVCNPATLSCYSNECSNCPGVTCIKNVLRELFDKNFIDTVTYKKWTSTDRSNLETQIDSIDEFIEKFCVELLKLLLHDFVAKSQSQYLGELKANLEPGEFLVLGDFAENFTFVIQDAIQSYHWNNAQATLHPIVVYYKKDDQLLHESYVVISDCLQHDAITVNLFIKKFIEQLKLKHTLINKIKYFSDGAGSQYKNKSNFINLTHHYKDFKIKAEWHFFATSHGKSPCDGIGGTVKRSATKASLQRPVGDQLTTPLSLYEWAKEALPNMTFIYSTEAEYENHTKYLKPRFDKAKPLPGSRSFHCFIPMNETRISCKSVSISDQSQEFEIQKKKKKKVTPRLKTKAFNGKRGRKSAASQKTAAGNGKKRSRRTQP